MSDTPNDAAGVPSNPDVWSAKSKQSSIYSHFPPESYRDIHYDCWRCKQPAVFTAEEQKHAFEVRKAYIWQRRSLCGACFRERVAVEREIAECRRRWAAERDALRRDTDFLRRWLALFEALPGYGGEWDSANITMLQRLAGRADS